MSSNSLPAFTFADLFAGIGGFHAVLAHAGGQCVYVSEIDRDARKTYAAQWLSGKPKSEWPTINHDIRDATPISGDVEGVPTDIDVLAAGFPCQPFSKSGYQRGMDEARGTLFWNIARILEMRKPRLVLLENVRNIAGPRHRNSTWVTVTRTLRELGYQVSSTPSVFSPHLLPPSLGGTPQVRDRVFILGTYVGDDRAEQNVPPTVSRGPVDGWDPSLWSIEWILDPPHKVGAQLAAKYELTSAEKEWIGTWDKFVRAHRRLSGERLPGFPLWERHWVPTASLNKADLDEEPTWRRDFLLKNAAFYDEFKEIIDDWRHDNPQLQEFPESRRKLEWQAPRACESLWDTLLQLRPSGIRAKTPSYAPALVAITQTSIVGRQGRRITPHEAARLQGLTRDFTFAPDQLDPASYRQMGNGVSVGAAWYVLREHVLRDEKEDQLLPERLRRAILRAPANPSPGVLQPEAYEVEKMHRNRCDNVALMDDRSPLSA